MYRGTSLMVAARIAWSTPSPLCQVAAWSHFFGVIWAWSHFPCKPVEYWERSTHSLLPGETTSKPLCQVVEQAQIL